MKHERKSFFASLLGGAPAAAPEVILPEGALEALTSPLDGGIISLQELADATFAQKILGDGLAVRPSAGRVYAPVDGVVENLMDTKHALCMVSEHGAELLIHVGRDTVSLNGRGFTAHVKEGQRVKRGELLLEFDRETLLAEGLDLDTPMVISNCGEYRMELTGQAHAVHGDVIITLYPRD